MNWLQIIDTVLQHKIRFIATFFVVFLTFYIVLFIVDFLPEPPTEEVVAEAVVELSEADRAQMSDETDVLQSVPETALIEIEVTETEPVVAAPTQDLPVSMYIEALDRQVDVLNPLSRSIADLDQALLGGLVRHPDSAAPNQDGNVFILGHSSYLPNIFNRNFQALNGIQHLEWGDVITLTSADTVYTYRVERVYQAKASEVTVPISGTGQMLTIATCDSFGSTDDRFIVEATLQSTKPV